jgi:hypothetical protein
MSSTSSTSGVTRTTNSISLSFNLRVEPKPEENSPPPRPPTPYTADFCEENVYKLIEHLHNADTNERWEIYAMFISNANKSVLLWQQRLSSKKDRPVLWDYHVVAIIRSRVQPLDSWIYDLDSTLPVPVPLVGKPLNYVALSIVIISNFLEYVSMTFCPELVEMGRIPDQFQR